jgi:hypothetical protein
MNVLLALSVYLLTGPPASAPAQNPGTKDPQAAFEPLSKPGEGQKFLEHFVGVWDVEKAFFPRSGPATRQKGTVRQTMIHGGRFLQCEFTFQRGDEKTTGTGLIGFDAATGLFTSVWVDSRSTRLSLRHSKEKFDGKQIVLFSRSLAEDNNGKASRTVTRLEDNGRRIVHRQYTAGDDGKERLVMELLLTKAAATSSRER